MNPLTKKTIILVTGANGVLGKAILNVLSKAGFTNILAPTKNEMDMRDQSAVCSYLSEHRPEVIIHLASIVFGLAGNLANQMYSVIENTTINNNLFMGLMKYPVKKLFFAGTVASYAFPYTSLPLKEEMFFNGLPHYGEFGYAMAKRHAYTYLRILSKETGLQYIYGIFTNLYGAYDKFDVQNGHVIPSLVAKAYYTQKTGGTLDIWGDGSAERDFLYSEDAARAVLLCLEQQSTIDLINISSGVGCSIKHVAELLARIAGISNLSYQKDKPVGIQKRVVDNTNLLNLGFCPKTSLETGLLRTYQYYSSLQDS